MVWEHWGLIWSPTKKGHQFSHAAVPTPAVVSDYVVRVFVSPRDVEGRATPMFLDVEVDAVPKVLSVSGRLLELGPAGSFDSHGVVATSARLTGDGWVLHYAGFEQFGDGDYRMAVGRAEARGTDTAFLRSSHKPVVNPADYGFTNMAGAVWLGPEDDRIIFSAGTGWTHAGGKARPNYSVYVAKTQGGVDFQSDPSVLIESSEDYFGVGRPWPCSEGDEFRMLVSMRNSRNKYSYAAYGLGSDLNLDEAVLLQLPTQSQGSGQESAPPVFAASVRTAAGYAYFYNGADLGREGLFCSLRREV